MCMLTETMRGKLRVERRRVLNHNPNTGSYWVVSTGTALRESRKNIDLLKCEMCFAQRRATTAARLLKERQPPISVNKRNKLLTHKGLSARLTAKGWQQKVGVKRRKREKTNNVKMLEHALSGWALHKNSFESIQCISTIMKNTHAIHIELDCILVHMEVKSVQS